MQSHRDIGSTTIPKGKHTNGYLNKEDCGRPQAPRGSSHRGGDSRCRNRGIRHGERVPRRHGHLSGGGGGYGAFGYCDGDTYPDGSYDHTVMIFGGWQASRVCPPDPGNPAIPLAWTPGQQCAFRK